MVAYRPAKISPLTFWCLSFCSNSVNIYVGIGIPWLIDTTYNFIAYREPLRIENAGGLSFSLLVFFSTSVGCISVLVLRRLTLGAELGGPRFWAWVTSVFFMLLWVIFVVLSSLRVSGIIWYETIFLCTIKNTTIFSCTKSHAKVCLLWKKLRLMAFFWR